MNPLLQILPFLALIAFQSIEVTAQVAEQSIGATTYPALASAGHINGFDISWTTTAKDTNYTISTLSGGGCTAAEVTAQSCKVPAIQWEEGDVPEITITAMNVPPAAELSVLGGTPDKIRAYFCFSPPSALNKKWRKINDVFKKDNSCKLSTILKATDAVDYPPNGNPALVLGTMKLDPKAPTAYFTIRAKVMCNDGDRVAAKNEFCHVVNRHPVVAEGEALQMSPDVFFPTIVMDSRPTRLYAAVLICACIGPLIFLGFMIYERGFLAKQA